MPPHRRRPRRRPDRRHDQDRLRDAPHRPAGRVRRGRPVRRRPDDGVLQGPPDQAGGTSYGVEILLKDSQSDPKRAGEVAGELINTDGVDILMAHATPETTVPVAAQCEANATPCITADTPWQPWVAGLGGNPGDPADGVHVVATTSSGASRTWQPSTWTCGTRSTRNKKVAALYPNDADGQAFTDTANGLPGDHRAGGLHVRQPGPLPERHAGLLRADLARSRRTTTRSSTAIVPPPDFATFWKQAKQQGYNPKVVTIGKAIEFPAAVEALGDLAAEPRRPRCGGRPTYPTTSSLTGMSSAEFAENVHRGDRQAVERHPRLLRVAVRGRGRSGRRRPAAPTSRRSPTP